MITARKAQPRGLHALREAIRARLHFWTRPARIRHPKVLVHIIYADWKEKIEVVSVPTAEVEGLIAKLRETTLGADHIRKMWVYQVQEDFFISKTLADDMTPEALQRGFEMVLETAKALKAQGDAK